MKYAFGVLCIFIAVMQSSAQVIMYSTTKHGTTKEALIRIDGRMFSTTNKYGSRLHYFNGYRATPAERSTQLQTTTPAGTFKNTIFSVDVFGAEDEIRFLIREGQHRTLTDSSGEGTVLNRYWTRPVLGINTPQLIAGILQAGYLPEIWTALKVGTLRHVAEILPTFNHYGNRVYQLWTVTPNGTRGICKYVLEGGIIYKTTPNGTRGDAIYRFIGDIGNVVACSGTSLNLVNIDENSFEFDASCNGVDGNYTITWESCGVDNVDIRLYEFIFSGGQCECEPMFMERREALNVPASLGTYTFDCEWRYCTFAVEINNSVDTSMKDADTVNMPCKQGDMFKIVQNLNPSFSPNPVNSQGLFTFNSTIADNVYLNIVNSNGEQVLDMMRVNAIAGKNTVPISTESLPSGAYFIRISGNEGWNFVIPFSVLH